MPNELKPCPFCGSKAHIYQKGVKNEYWHDFNYKYIAMCNKCKAHVGEYLHRDTAIKAWNRRVGNG